MLIIETDDFLAGLKAMPVSIRRLYRTQKERLTISTSDSRLHLKKLVGLEGVHSFRVTSRYRVLFYFQNTDTIVVFIIGHRKDVYR